MKSLAIEKAAVNQFRFNVHELEYNWQPCGLLTSVKYVDLLCEKEIPENKVQSIVAVPTISNYRTNFVENLAYKNKILIVDDQSFNIEALKIIL